MTLQGSEEKKKAVFGYTLVNEQLINWKACPPGRRQLWLTLTSTYMHTNAKTLAQLYKDAHPHRHTQTHTHAVMTFDRLCVCVLIESPESLVGTWHQESLRPASLASRWMHTTATKSSATQSLHHLCFSKGSPEPASLSLCPSRLIFKTKSFALLTA